MMYLTHLWARRVLALVLRPALLRLLSPRRQTLIWHKVHGPLLNRRKSPRVLREYILCDLILRTVPRLSGPSSILEFGVSSGALTQRLLHFLDVASGRAKDIMVYGFDTFQGLPEGDPATDFQGRSVDGGPDHWAAGSFACDRRTVEARLRGFGFENFRLVEGRFAQTLTDQLLSELAARPSFLVVIDCDYYTSTVEVLERLLPVLPNGCVFYFDDTFLNHYSRLTGEMRAIHELNQGRFGDGYELVEAYDLGLLGRRFYRFVSLAAVEDRTPGDRGRLAGAVIEPSEHLSPALRGRRIEQRVINPASPDEDER